MTTITKVSKLLIEIILTDSKIAEKVFENTHDKEKYKICTVNGDGTIVLGKTSCKWWNKLINCQDKLTFESFALKVWDALVDSSSGMNNIAILKGLSQEIIMKSVRTREYDWVVHRLYDCWTHVAQKSAGYEDSVSPEGDSAKNQDRKIISIPESATQRNIVINVNGSKKIIPFVDSIGDPLNLGLEFGITGIKKL